MLFIDVEYLDIDSRVVHFVCVYRSKNTDMASSLQFLKALASDIVPFDSETLIVIVGDFN